MAGVVDVCFGAVVVDATPLYGPSATTFEPPARVVARPTRAAEASAGECSWACARALTARPAVRPGHGRWSAYGPRPVGRPAGARCGGALLLGEGLAVEGAGAGAGSA